MISYKAIHKMSRAIVYYTIQEMYDMRIDSDMYEEYDWYMCSMLCDINNTPIYEGDCIEYEDSMGDKDQDTVVFTEGCFMLKDMEDELYHYCPECKVIGNVYI